MHNRLKIFSKSFLMLFMVALVVLAVNMADASAKEAKTLVDLNSADQKALESLPGVGPATAREIIKARPFKDVDDLGRVKGMSKGKIEKLRGMVTVGQAKAEKPSAPPAPAAQKPPKAGAAAPKAPSGAEKKSTALAPGERVNINTASKEKLEALTGIGPAKAQAIIDGRPYNSPEDIMKVKGIKQGTYNKIKDQITVR